MRRSDDLSLFICGAAGYGALELVWRGRTHWTMALTGGACLTALAHLNKHMAGRPLMLRALAGAGMITGAELAVGLLVNRRLGWNVWDYSRMRGNILGQICPQYALAWYALCLVALPALSRSQAKSANKNPTGCKKQKPAGVWS